MFTTFMGNNPSSIMQFPFMTGTTAVNPSLFQAPQAFTSPFQGTDNLATGMEATGLMQNTAMAGLDPAALQGTTSAMLSSYMQLMIMAAQFCAMQEAALKKLGLDGLNGGNNNAIDNGGNNNAIDNGGNNAIDNGGNNNGIQSGNATVDLADNYLNRDSIGLKGDLPRFQAAGGVTNNCADFVSACLEDTGRLQGHEVNVSQLEQSLKKQGYKEVPREQAKPGDVWISNGNTHTELVAEAGGKALIGSNGSERQKVSIDRYSGMNGGKFYQKAA